MKKTLIVAAVTASFATAASAQSSVTLYGLIDAGFTFVNNQVSSNAKGHAQAYNLTSGNLDGSRWGSGARKTWVAARRQSSRWKAASAS